MNTKNNQRFKDNEKRFEQALLQLSKTMPYQKMTVRALCEQAHLNRTTFYAHYYDIEDMIEKMEAHMHEDLLARFDTTNHALFSPSSFTTFLHYIKDHQSFYRIALHTRHIFPLQQGYDPLWKEVIQPLCIQNGITDPDEMTYYLIYFQAGFTMALRHWVDTNCQISEKQFAQLLIHCLPSIWQEKKNLPEEVPAY